MYLKLELAEAGEEDACRSAAACAVLPPADERRLWCPVAAAAATMAAAESRVEAAPADCARPAATLLLLTAR